MENLPEGKLLDRDTDFINMGTYNYGGNGVTHSIMDVVPYNGSGKFGYGNVGEDLNWIAFEVNDYRGKKYEDIIELNHLNIEKFIESLGDK